MITEHDILQKLSLIIDPDFNRDIVSLGFVKNIHINGGEISFDIALTTPACPVKDEFKRQAERLVREITGVTGVTVHMTTLPRKTSQTPQDFETPLQHVKSIIAVSSCKGGVGKSTIAAHLAMELAQRGVRVGLVDTDIFGPSIPSLFNIQRPDIHVTEKQQLIPIEFHNLKIMSFGFLLGDAPAVMRGPMVTRYVQQVLHGTDWGELDYLFIDMPPGTGDVQLTITQSIRLNGAIIVTTRQTLSVVDVSRGILMFEKVNVPILGIVENMAYFICDQCDKKHYIFGDGSRNSLQERFGLETLGEIPILPQMTFQIDRPFRNEYIMSTVDHAMRALGRQSILQKQIPTIYVEDDKTSFAWPDGKKLEVLNKDLRLSCRCALCVNEMTGENLLRPENIPADIKPLKITPLGNYAVGIEWSDGHSSGIYPYKAIEHLEGTR